MKILVTGGGGFIGSHLVEALLARGDEVTILDDFSTGRRENLAPFGSRVRVVEGTLLDDAAREAALSGGVTHVSHQAAVPSVPRSIADPVTTFRVNSMGTSLLLEAARARGVRRLVFASSSSIYGDNPALPKEESMFGRPLSPYAASKAGGEGLVISYGKVYPIETVALRYFNIFGPRQDPKNPYAAVIAKFMDAALAKKSPVVYGDGTQSRDFTYVANAVQANLLALEAPTAPGEVMNIATGRRVTLLDLLGALKTLAPDLLPAEFQAPRTGDVPHSHADISRARRVLGYDPRVTFEEGLAKTWDWFRYR